MTDGVLVFGASQRTGLEVTKILAGRGENVTAFVRPTSDRTELEELQVDFAIGDVVDANSVEAAFAAGKFRAVVNTIGGKRGEEPRPDFIGIKNMVDSAKRHGVKRALLVTMVGTGDSSNVLSENARKFLGPVAELKTQAEDYLMESGLDATILRPGGMLSQPATGTAIKTEDHSVMGVIHRADLAVLVVESLDDDATIGKIFHTVDPEIKEQPGLQRGEAPKPGQEKP
ncbi:MAG: SDR family oxidoreductase [Gammaproteobacteria bacterium]|nr:SDR family oxidoreductase [Gammaproteobacteria bacterium]